MASALCARIVFDNVGVGVLSCAPAIILKWPLPNSVTHWIIGGLAHGQPWHYTARESAGEEERVAAKVE